MRWDGTGMNCHGMGWDRNICPMDIGQTCLLVTLQKTQLTMGRENLHPKAEQGQF